MPLGPYEAFIVASYALVAIVVAALAAWIALDHRIQARKLRDLEGAGVTRRSARGPAGRA